MTDTAAPTARVRSPRRRTTLARGLAVVAAVLLVVLLAGLIPGPPGSVVAAALPWIGIPVAGLLTAALLLRRRLWIIAVVPVAAWLIAVGSMSGLPAGFPFGAGAGDTLTFAAQNVEAHSGTAGQSALDLGRTADVVALTELDGDAREEAAAALDATHPYSYAVGTVGVWSRLPIVDQRPLDLGLGWNRALAAEVETPGGIITVFVVHAASWRPGDQAERDTMLAELGREIADTGSERVVALGDFNAAPTDPALAGIRAELSEPGLSSPSFGFTWPAAFPLVRIDHLYQRGLTPVESRVQRVGASDHLAVISRLSF
ncbi:vancomycin resistance protein VanJ [Microbacterium resistens]|uniref:Vancomycin resistance protein VanJ n=1 Tax=Microbacterium resistens TaxID=156977 RepID=A0ABU1SFL3_9MICO|nr:endonuclease/exonuclease/phosphatase family protein [Microbacterium resistens]MDR6868389.1 vancomycin resistance protein VanJ [Microbacterium resistens]